MTATFVPGAMGVDRPDLADCDSLRLKAGSPNNFSVTSTTFGSPQRAFSLHIEGVRKNRKLEVIDDNQPQCQSILGSLVLSVSPEQEQQNVNISSSTPYNPPNAFSINDKPKLEKNVMSNHTENSNDSMYGIYHNSSENVVDKTIGNTITEDVGDV